MGFEVFDREVPSHWAGLAVVAVLEVFQRGSEGLGECDCAFECVAESFCGAWADESGGFADECDAICAGGDLAGRDRTQ